MWSLPCLTNTILFSNMLDHIAQRNWQVPTLVEPTNWHRAAVVVAEIQRQAFRKIQWKFGWILALVMDMDMRFTGVTRIAARANYLSFCNLITRMYSNTARLKMRENQISSRFFHLDHHVVAGWRCEVV